MARRKQPRSGELTQRGVREQLKVWGVRFTIARDTQPTEFRVCLPDCRPSEVFLTTDLQDALATGRQLGLAARLAREDATRAAIGAPTVADAPPPVLQEDIEADLESDRNPATLYVVRLHIETYGVEAVLATVCDVLHGRPTRTSAGSHSERLALGIERYLRIAAEVDKEHKYGC